MSAWIRLQRLSCEHAARIGRCGYFRQHQVPDVIVENVEILGRGDDEEIKHRVHWYIAFHPSVFNFLSARNWEATV